MITRLVSLAFVLGIALAAGCSGTKDDKTDGKTEEKKTTGGPRKYLTDENVRAIMQPMTNRTMVQAILGGKPGTPTNEEIPGLRPPIMYWEEDGRKVYVSFDPLKDTVTNVKESWR